MRSPPSSRLETLPVELLQRIFLDSLELNLPRCSPHLGRALANPLLYTWLIRLAFSSANPGSREAFFTPDFLPPPLDFWALGWEARQRLQTAILACRWCTLPLLRQCQREYVDHAIRRKCADLVFQPDDEATLGRATGKGDLVMPAWRRENAQSPPDSSARSIDRKVAIWFHFGAVQVREPNEIYYENDLFRLPCAVTIGPGRIPDKVLRMPWSDAQFEFLQLLATDFYLDEDEYSSERSAEITARLIRKRSIEPLRRLLRMSFRAANCRVLARWPLQSAHYALLRRYSSGPGDPLASVVLNERWDEIPSSAREDLVRFVHSALPAGQ